MTEFQERLTVALAGRYAVERRVGGGGMADVFLARDLKHGREVALKLLRPDIGAAIGHERFLREITIAAGLHHPHILPLYDSGEADGLLYYVMPYLKEETLRVRLARARRLPLAEVLRITDQLADALDFANSRGVIHRDVKPENVLLLADHVVIADFGIALAATGGPGDQITGTGIIVGTPTYMSPEQVFGDTTLDGRSDQYSLACMVFEMLCGSPPYSGNTAMAVMARLSVERAPTLATRETTVPAAVDDALNRALAKDPGDRFPTCRAFAEALHVTGAPAAVPLTSKPRSLVVLPFANLSEEADTEFLSDGLTEELIHTLNTLPGLRVVGRTSAFAFKGAVDDVRTIGRKLGVELVLEGSVRRGGQRLRITTQLIDVKDGLPLWSERFERPVGDAFAIQDEIAGAILATLRLTFLGRSPSLPADRTNNPRAYELYLRGRHCWNARTETGLQQSLAYLQQAIAVDPEFGLAHAALAEAYVTLGVYGAEPPRTVMPLAEAAARAALECNPRLAEAHGALASVQALYHWQWIESESSYRRALAANPGAAGVRQSFAVNLLLPLKRWDEARAELERARALEPLSPVISLSLGLISFFQRDCNTAIRIWREVLVTNENFPLLYYFLGRALSGVGRGDEAIAALERATQLAGSTAENIAALAATLARAGRREEAQGHLARLNGLADRRWVSPLLQALVLLALEEPEPALEAITRAIESRASDLVWLDVRADFDRVRGDPRFITLREQVFGPVSSRPGWS
ncbi:MAG TPA: protein kinase [Gemmatimonadales bacterium]|nr:protein kinase [Gemmatimonadales bacterium]